MVVNQLMLLGEEMALALGMVVNQLMLLGEEMALELALALGMVVNQFMLLDEEMALALALALGMVVVGVTLPKWPSKLIATSSQRMVQSRAYLPKPKP